MTASVIYKKFFNIFQNFSDIVKFSGEFNGNKWRVKFSTVIVEQMVAVFIYKKFDIGNDLPH